jgi:peptidoglycan/LPS O-acetylase OafA/YrhL
LAPHERSGRFSYRPALDGLRAIALVAVLIYHLGYSWFPGGFIGVDVFFVLSGYLITSLLLIELDRTGRIDLREFWLRRARRLLPALILMLLAVALWTAATAPPLELPLRRQDIFWTLFYGANWHFIASGQDYFAQFTSASPLRHTWSLAVEEQFYIAWPVLVVGAVAVTRRRRLAVMTLCGIGIAISTVAAAWLFRLSDPSRVYYGTDTRIYEPLLGALLAASLRGQPSRWHRHAGPLVSLAGATALGAAFFFLDEHNSAYYFGLSLALAACTAAVIWGVEAAPSGAMARALSWQPVRWVGGVSYGLYLWHWPVILAVTSAPHPLSLLPGSAGLNLARMLVTFGIAVASFYLLEQPIRRGRALWVRSSAPRFVVTSALAVVLVVGVTVWVTQVPPEAMGFLDIPGCPSSGDMPCLRRQGASGAPVVAVIGDSIARSLDPAFMLLAQEREWTYVLAAANGCRISGLLTIYNGHTRPMDEDCHDATPRRLERLLTDWNPSTIVAIDRWEIIDAAGSDGQVASSGTPAHLSLTERALTDTARQLTSQGARLAFIELPPTVFSGCSAPSQRSSSSCRRGVMDDVAQTPYNELFRRISRTVPGVSTLSITDALCPAGVCTWDINGMVLRFDGLHFTPETSRWLAPTILQRLSTAGIAPEADKFKPSRIKTGNAG